MARATRTKPVSIARAPLVAALAQARSAAPSTWPAAAGGFLDAMWEFDGFVASGSSTQGDRQNGKGDYFNDLLALLLENCSAKQLHTRPNVPGLSFKKNKLDVAYPKTGMVEFTIETKATGVPRHPGNTKQKHPEGRGGAADLDKRLKEAAFKNIDLKAEAARHAGQGGGPTSDLNTFIRTAPPKCYLFLSVRVRDDADLARTIAFADIGRTWFDACGVFAYGKNKKGNGYEARPVPASVELDRVLSGVCTALRNLP